GAGGAPGRGGRNRSFCSSFRSKNRICHPNKLVYQGFNIILPQCTIEAEAWRRKRPVKERKGAQRSGHDSPRGARATRSAARGRRRCWRLARPYQVVSRDAAIGETDTRSGWLTTGREAATTTSGPNSARARIARAKTVRCMAAAFKGSLSFPHIGTAGGRP